MTIAPAEERLTSWQAIRDEVLRRIRAREWKPGAGIPNEADLAIQFGCARATVNRALRDLAEAGVLERRRRAGTRVAAAPGGRARLEIPVLHRDVEEMGARYGYELLSAATEPVPPELAERLRLPPGTSLFHVRSLHRADDRPHVFEDRWINLAVVPRIAEVDLTIISANEWLVENMPFSEGDMRIAAVSAGEAARPLKVSINQALLMVERSTWREGQPITFVRQFFAPGHWIDLDLATG